MRTTAPGSSLEQLEQLESFQFSTNVARDLAQILGKETASKVLPALRLTAACYLWACHERDTWSAAYQHNEPFRAAGKRISATAEKLVRQLEVLPDPMTAGEKDWMASALYQQNLPPGTSPQSIVPIIRAVAKVGKLMSRVGTLREGKPVDQERKSFNLSVALILDGAGVRVTDSASNAAISDTTAPYDQVLLSVYQGVGEVLSDTGGIRRHVVRLLKTDRATVEQLIVQPWINRQRDDHAWFRKKLRVSAINSSL